MEIARRATDAADAPGAEGELRLVRQAIIMVSEYGTPRVVVAGLEHGSLILEPCRRLAMEAGVRLIPLPAARNDHLDFAVERLAP
jgi:hypothetical protein